MVPRRKRLVFRSWHRGSREMDLILGPFADRHVPLFTDRQLALYETLLEEQDPVLYDWILGRVPVPPRLQHDVMDLLRSFSASAVP
ncbi:MAG: succinate dehydrogenase assembly factor 2 [Pseudomonadota bacterium]|nr:succinate dehydrogenase assembly factor 2 [Pseudomonadota bacterium]